MTTHFVNLSLIGANAIAAVNAVTSQNPFLEYIQSGASVAAIMGIFLWREMKLRERYERLYDEERKQRLDSENKCSSCAFVKQANEEFLNERKNQK